MLTTGQTVSERYQIISEAGSGDLGMVYKAVDAQTGHTYAARLLPESLLPEDAAGSQVRSLLDESPRIKTPNVAAASISGISDEGRPFILREYVEGETLTAVMARDGAFSLQQFVPILQSIATALEAGHRAGAVHGSLHPNNVLLASSSGGEKVWIVDWGIARLKGKQLYEVGRLTLKTSGTLLGKPAYYAPEQALGRHGSQLDSRTDLYALGLIAFQMLTGKQAFAAENEMELLLAQVFNNPPSLREAAPGVQVPSAIEGLILKLLSKKREARPLSAGAVIEALRDSRPSRVVLTAPVMEEQAKARVTEMELGLPATSLPALEQKAKAEFTPTPRPAPVMAQAEVQAESPSVARPPATAPQAESQPEEPPARPKRNAIAEAMERSKERALPNHGSVLFGSGSLIPSAKARAAQAEVSRQNSQTPKRNRYKVIGVAAVVLLIAGALGAYLFNPSMLPSAKRWASRAVAPVRQWRIKADATASAKPPSASAVPQTLLADGGAQSSEGQKQPAQQPAQELAGSGSMTAQNAPSPPAGAPTGSSLTAKRSAATDSPPTKPASAPPQNAATSRTNKTGNDNAALQRALERGDYFFKLGKYDNAISAYNEGLASHHNNKLLVSRIERAIRAKAAEQEYLNR